MNYYAPVFDAQAQPNVVVCMSAMKDVARWVVRVLDMQVWPLEMTMIGQRWVFITPRAKPWPIWTLTDLT